MDVEAKVETLKEVASQLKLDLLRERRVEENRRGWLMVRRPYT